tara:strand:- start:199 stop:567 length:369 start_codon:yes stop_codon:yes gene_type:complete
MYDWASNIALPIALTVSSVIISSSIERSKVSSEYVKMAVAILASKPTESAESIEKQKSQKALKSWAVRVLDANSPVKMTSHEKSSFENNGLEEIFKQMHQIKIKDLEEISKNLQAIKTEQGK